MLNEDQELLNTAKTINRALSLNNRVDSLINIDKKITNLEREYLKEYILMYRNLTLAFGDDRLIKKWLRSFDYILGVHPINKIHSLDSLRTLNEYLIISNIN